MAKQIQGECNRCGRCGCYERAGGLPKRYPGLGGFLMAWGKQHPEQDLEVCQLIRAAYIKKFHREWNHDYESDLRIKILGDTGAINVDLYIGKRGIQKSPDDASCPFVNVIENATIVGTTFTPTTVTGPVTGSPTVDNLAVASGGSVGIVSGVGLNTLTVHSWVDGIPADGETVKVVTTECLLWGKSQLPWMCAKSPQDYVGKQIDKWIDSNPHTSNAGTCGYYWVDV